VLDRNNLREYIPDQSGNYRVNIIDKNESGWKSGAAVVVVNEKMVVIGRNKLKIYSTVE